MISPALDPRLTKGQWHDGLPGSADRPDQPSVSTTEEEVHFWFVADSGVSAVLPLRLTGARAEVARAGRATVATPSARERWCGDGAGGD